MRMNNCFLEQHWNVWWASAFLWMLQASLFEKPVNLEAAKTSHSEFRCALWNPHQEQRTSGLHGMQVAACADRHPDEGRPDFHWSAAVAAAPLCGRASELDESSVTAHAAACCHHMELQKALLREKEIRSAAGK